MLASPVVAVEQRRRRRRGGWGRRGIRSLVLREPRPRAVLELFSTIYLYASHSYFCPFLVFILLTNTHMYCPSNVIQQSV